MSPEVSSSPTKKKTSSTAVNLILASVLIAVSSFAYWYEFKKRPEQNRTAETSGKLLGLDTNREYESIAIYDKEKAVAVEIACKQRCKLSDPSGEWEIQKPTPFKADEGNVGTFVASVTNSNVQDNLTFEGQDFERKLQDFGLAKAKRDERKVAIKLKGEAEPYTIYVGDNTAVGESMYVYLTGPGAKKDAIKIIPNNFRSNMQRAQSYWRSKRLFEFSGSEVQSLVLKNNAGTVTLTKEGLNWFLPGKALADNEAVDTFVTGLAFTNATDFISDDKIKERTKIGLPSKPTAVLTVKPATQPEVVLEIYDFQNKAKQPKLYATLKDKNYVVELDYTNADKFKKKAEAFRFRNLLSPAEKVEIRKFTASFGTKEKFTFEGESPNWKLSSGTIENLDPAKIDPALVKVASARVAEFLGKGSVPKGTRELAAWAFHDKSGHDLRSFIVYGTNEKGDYYVKFASGEVGKLERGSGAALPLKITDFQKGVTPPQATAPVSEQPSLAPPMPLPQLPNQRATTK